METRNYKTLRGLLSHACSRRQVTAEDFFSDMIYHAQRGWINFTLPADEKRRAAEMFAEYLFATPSARRGLADALCEGRGDFSFLQSFYIILSKGRGCMSALRSAARVLNFAEEVTKRVFNHKTQ